MAGSVLFSGASVIAAVLWLAGYVATGYGGLALTSLPGTWLTLLWLPSGIGLAAVWMLGFRRGLPLVMAGSLIVNASGIFAAQPSDLPTPLAVLLLGAVAFLDTAQTAVAAHLWGQCGPLGPVVGPGRQRGSSAGAATGHLGGGGGLAWSLPLFGRFVLAVLAAPLLTCWGFVLLTHTAGYAGPVDLATLLRETVMVTVADALGMVLITPSLVSILRGLIPTLGGRLDGLGEDMGSALGFGLLALVPVGLSLQTPEALVLLAPLMALALLRHRVLGVALATMVSGVALTVLSAHGVFPAGEGEALSTAHLNALILCLALTVLLLGVACEQMHQERHLLADRVALRTHELSEALAMAERMGQTDLLTGLGNRRALQDCLTHEAAVASRRVGADETDLSLLVINLDGFRRLNEQHGAALGDRALVAAAGALSQLCRGTDTLFRSSAGEFTLICRSTPLNGALVLARKLSAAVSALRLSTEEPRHDSDLPPFLAGLTGAADLTIPPGDTIPLSACFGVATLNPGEDWEQWQRRADEALQEARSEGPGRVRVG